MTFTVPTRYCVRVVLSRQQALTGMAYAHAHDVERGGIYDGRSAAINVWSCPWDTPEHRQESELVGTIYLAWNTPHADLATIRQIDVEHGWRLADVERHLALLFGYQGGAMMSYLSKAEREGYAALDRAKAMNHYMELDERWPVVGTRWACRCGAWVAMMSYTDNTTGTEVDPRVDQPCATWALAQPYVLTHEDDATTQLNLDDQIGQERQP